MYGLILTRLLQQDLRSSPASELFISASVSRADKLRVVGKCTKFRTKRLK